MSYLGPSIVIALHPLASTTAQSRLEELPITTTRTHSLLALILLPRIRLVCTSTFRETKETEGGGGATSGICHESIIRTAIATHANAT